MNLDAFQASLGILPSALYRDFDPDGYSTYQNGGIEIEEVVGGGTPDTYGIADSWNLSFLFLETIRDYNVVYTARGWHTWDYGLLFAHEIGHAGRNDRTHIEDGIMNEEGKSFINGIKMDYYDNGTLKIFRESQNW